MLTVTSGSEATTDRILDAAYDELLHFGVRRVSVEDIAKRVGVARITIYRRFQNKDDLLAAVAVREGHRLFAEVDAAIGPSARVEDQLVEGFTAMLFSMRAHPLVKRILASEPDIAASLLTTHAAPIIAFAREVVAERLNLPRPVAELMVRLGASFILTPDSCIALKTPDDARVFARTYLIPMIPSPRKASR